MESTAITFHERGLTASASTHAEARDVRPLTE